MAEIDAALLRRAGVVFPLAVVGGFGVSEGLLLGRAVDALPEARRYSERGLALPDIRTAALAGQAVLVSAIRVGGYQFPIPPVITITGQKNVEISPTTGGAPVIEIIANDAWSIEMRGYVKSEAVERVDGIAYEPTAYPEEQVRAMRRLFEVNDALDVECVLLSLFGISRVVIMDFRWQPLEGVPAVVYEVKMVSDVPVELEVLDGV